MYLTICRNVRGVLTFVIHCIYIYIYIYICMYVYVCIYLCIYAYIYVRLYIVKLVTSVEGDPKAHLSIATTPRRRRGRCSITMLTVKEGGIKYLFFESMVWLDLGLNHGLPNHWWTLYSLDQYVYVCMYFIYVYLYACYISMCMYICIYVCVCVCIYIYIYI